MPDAKIMKLTIKGINHKDNGAIRFRDRLQRLANQGSKLLPNGT